MELVNEWLKSLDPLVAYLSFCLSQPMQAPACRQFWTWSMIAAFAVALAAALALAWRFVSYKLKLAAALRAQRERERIADEETLARYRWSGEDVVTGDAAAGDDVEARIRAALEERRNRNAP